MNLHGIVAGAIGAVNPMRPMVVKQSTGYTIVNYVQTPTYTTLDASGQVQALTGKDLAMLNGLSVQGATNAIYLAGNYEGVFRVLGKGGYLIVFGGLTYLVAAVLERWPDWCKLAVVVQMDTTP
jgi:hypothetical protein